MLVGSQAPGRRLWETRLAFMSGSLCLRPGRVGPRASRKASAIPGDSSVLSGWLACGVAVSRGPGPVAAFAVGERTDGVLLTLAYCGTCGKQPTRGDHALCGARSTSHPQALCLSPQTSLPPTRLREVAFPWESLPTPTSPQQVHVFGFLPPSCLPPCLPLSLPPALPPVSGLLSCPNQSVQSFLHYLPPHSLRISDPLD